MSSASPLCDASLLAARDGHIARLSSLFAGQPQAEPFYLSGIGASGTSDPYNEPEQWVVDALESLAAQADRLKEAAVFRPLCLEFSPYGVHFIDRMLGARVYLYNDQWWSEPLKSPVGSLKPPDLDHDETWHLARRIAEAFVGREVTVPFFGLPTIASPLNIAVNLYGEAFLSALVEGPDAARRDLETINALLCRLHRWYRARIPDGQLQPVVAAGRCQPPGFGQLCGCSTQLLSGAACREFVAPFDDALLSVYPNGGMIHLCGAHTQHIPVWRAMKSLRAVQVNDRAAEDLQTYFHELRPDQILYLNPCEKMTAEQAIRITGGQRLVIVGDRQERT